MEKRTLPRMFNYLIGISGGSASGKTSFIQSLRELFDENELCLISQDNYYKEAHLHERDENGHINFDLPECIDMQAFLDDLKALKEGKTVVRKEYLFQLEGQQPEEIKIQPAPVVIVEGLFILHFREIFSELDLKIFIDADESLKLRRRIDRDIKERGVSRNHVIYQWENHVKPSYRKYLEPYKNESDLIVNNNEHFLTSLRVITDHIKTVIKNEL